MSNKFQVDLIGMVDLLSRHLYSGPQVYLRELLQNALDATTAAVSADPQLQPQVRLITDVIADDAVLTVQDNGVGLTHDEAISLLATIGNSSKRDPELGLGRHEFLGQFGIGMLAAFMVADRIEVLSHSRTPGSVPIRWIGHANGTFDITEEPELDHPHGTTFKLRARPEMAHWLSRETVISLATEYGSLLPGDIAVQAPLADTGELVWRRINDPQLPWQREYRDEVDRWNALSEYCKATFGFAPLGFIDLKLPVVGASGVAFILPQQVAPGAGHHRVYLKQMLLSNRESQILPEWAFFARAVINVEDLSPTASREGLHNDETLLMVREGLGAQLKTWAQESLTEDSELAVRFITTHHLALRALALSDDDMLDLVAQILPFETTDGLSTLTAAVHDGELVYTTTTESYQRVAAVAHAQGLVVVNAGYVYDADILARLGERHEFKVRELASDDVTAVLGQVSLGREAEVTTALLEAREVLNWADCDVILREFFPIETPAILLRDAEGEHQRALDREREAAPNQWAGLLDSFASDKATASRTLVLNDATELVRTLLAAPPGQVFSAGVHALYITAVMGAGEGLRFQESEKLHDAVTVLLTNALNSQDPQQKDR